MEQRGRQTPGRRPAPTAMDQSGDAPCFEPALQPPHLSQAHPERSRDLSAREATGTGRADQSRPMDFFPIQREGLH